MASRILLSLFTGLVGFVQAAAQPVYLASNNPPGWSPLSSPNSAIAVPSPTVHVLLVGDTHDPTIGAGVREDLARFTATLQRLTPDGVRVNFMTVQGTMATQQNILAAIAGLNVGKNDTVVFYWSGHGAYDDAGHFLILPKVEPMYRTQIINAMEAKQPRLTIVITDSCHEWVSSHLVAKRTANYAPSETSLVKDNFRLFTELLLKPYGLIDVNGAAPGEMAVMCDTGSLFTFVLCNQLQERSADQLSWRDLLALVNSDVREVSSRAYRNGKQNASQSRVYDHQSVRIWALPWDERGYRFGLTVGENWGDGVYVAQVFAGYPANNLRDMQTMVLYSLQPGDIIVAVNSQNIRNVRDFMSAVANSPQTMQLAVRDARSGRIHQFQSTLRY